MSEEEQDPQQKALDHIATCMTTVVETLQHAGTASGEHTDKIAEVLSTGFGALINTVNDGFQLIAQAIAERDR